MQVATRYLPDIILAADPYEMAEGCDAIVVCTEWNEFRHLDMRRIQASMRQPVIFDGRNIYDPEHMTRLGFRYQAVGRNQHLNGVDDVLMTPAMPSGL